MNIIPQIPSCTMEPLLESPSYIHMILHSHTNPRSSKGRSCDISKSFSEQVGRCASSWYYINFAKDS